MRLFGWLATAAAVALLTLIQLPDGRGAAIAGETEPLLYYALGDSVAAGHGLEKRLFGCRRSEDSYPWLVRDAINEESAAYLVPDDGFEGRDWFFHLACSGATSADVVAQVKQVLADPDVGGDQTTLVSITAGANDFDFLTEALTGAHGCAPEGEFSSWLTEQGDAFSSNLDTAIGQLKQRDNVYIVITDEMNPFNRESAYFDWLRDPHFNFAILRLLLTLFFGPVNPDCTGFSNGELYDRTQSVVDTVADSASDAADGNARVSYVPVGGAFDSHESATPNCGSDPDGPGPGETWIQYQPHRPDVLLKSFAGAIALIRGNDCFHPNAAGQEAIAGLVFDAAELLLP